MKGREPLAGTDDTGAGDGVESSWSENGYDTRTPHLWGVHRQTEIFANSYFLITDARLLSWRRR